MNYIIVSCEWAGNAESRRKALKVWATMPITMGMVAFANERKNPNQSQEKDIGISGLALCPLQVYSISLIFFSLLHRLGNRKLFNKLNALSIFTSIYLFLALLF